MTNVKPISQRSVDEDVAQFMQRHKDLNLHCVDLRDQLERALAALAESERKVQFLEEQMKNAAFDRDVYHRQYIALHTELTGLVQDCDHFRQTVVVALNRSNHNVVKNGTDERARENNVMALDESSQQQAEKLGEKFGAGNEDKI